MKNVRLQCTFTAKTHFDSYRSAHIGISFDMQNNGFLNTGETAANLLAIA